MKPKNFSILAFIAGILIPFILLTGCKSSPAAAPAQEDLWTLLSNGETDKARTLFLGKTDVNSTDELGRTPLHMAAELWDSGMGSFFISLGADVNAVDNTGRSALTIAAANRDAAMGGILTNAGADIHYRGPEGFSAAQIGIQEGGTFLEALATPSSVAKTNAGGQTLLHLASEYGSGEAARIILDRGASVNKRDRQGRTALDIALARGDSLSHAETAEVLILRGGYSEEAIFSYLAPAVRSSNYSMRTADGLAPIHFAAREGSIGIVRFLINKKADINAKNAAGMTALHESARSGDLETMSLLLSSGIAVNSRDAKGNTAMHIVMPPETRKNGLDLLFAYNADPNIKDDHGDTPLHIAIALNMDTATTDRLLSGGANVTIRNIEGKTPLHTALEEGRYHTIPLLLSRGADIFAADNHGVTPFDLALLQGDESLSAMVTPGTVTLSDSAGNTQLHIAVKNGAELRLISQILDYKAAVNARNQAGDTALHTAIVLNEAEIGELLISRGADIFAVNTEGHSPLYLGLTGGDPVRSWMLNPTVIAARDGLGNGPLHYAAQWKMDKVIPELAARGADIESPNATGETPLFIAVKQDSPSTIMSVLASGAQINGRDTLGNTALHAAVRWNAQSGTETLIYAGADINAHALNGKTPLHDSVRLGMVSIEETLAMHGAKLEERDNEGNTPFMEAVLAGLPAAAERLAERGADPTARNSRGDTPLHIAVGINRNDVATLLLTWGAPIHARNSSGKTPFQIALATSPAMVSTLLTKDRILASDDNGYSPLHIAVLDEAPGDMIRAIIQQGGRVSAIDSSGQTPLRAAINTENWEAARILADAGSDIFSAAADGESPATASLKKGSDAVKALFSGRAITARDSAGNTILHYAAQNGCPEMVALLIEMGASKNIKNVADESPIDIARRWNREEVTALLSG
ncbi:ankyrin repeat domain-containing protein [Breznakiella homolactica]|uniref:Ankyrin repeat domain-containing protein n=1 Tax=Breznakiella homolactica TaxID=2798577 RepID=A0A7T7XLS3_9SPIR|nr:ankyrin repeat domain-containing protein [Breznakiella homolactica]QQO08548.1 ankyrin repeat domain-containing protein [Breznakiella homolactica]